MLIDRLWIYVTDYGATGDGVTDDTAAIDTAIAAASAGNVVYFETGTYLITATITVAKAIVLLGEHGAQVIQDTADTNGFEITISDVRIEGLQITGDGDGVVGTSHGIKAYGTDGNTTITNVDVINCTVNDWSRYGIWFEYVTDFRINHNDLDDIFYSGISVSSCLRGQICKNSIRNISGSISGNSYGILMFRWTNVSDNLALTPHTQHILCSGNFIETNPTWQAINTHGGQDLIISNNVIQDCKYGIFLGPSNNLAANATWAPHNCTVIGNIIKSGVTDGTYAVGLNVTGAQNVIGNPTELAHGNRFIGNYVEGYGLDSSATASACIVDTTFGTVVSCNAFLDSSRSAIGIFEDNYGFVVSNNTITDSWTDAGLASYGIIAPNAYVYGVITGNVFNIDDIAGKAFSNDRCVDTGNHATIDISVGSNFNNGWTLYLVPGQANHFKFHALNQKITYGTAAPTAGSWTAGDLCLKTNATYADRSFIGWYCTTGGTPGTWQEWGRVDYPNLTVGDGTGAANVIMNTGGTGDGSFTYQFEGVARWQIFMDFSRGQNLRFYNTNLAEDALWFTRSTNDAYFGGDIYIQEANPELWLANITHEDTDGGRESSIRFRGEQSGGEIRTLAQIRGSHDGVADDENGQLEVLINDGDDVNTPTLRTTWGADGSLKHGDGGTTHYMQVAADGEVTLNGTARVKKHILLYPAVGQKAGVQDPTSALVGEFAVEKFSQAVTQNLYFIFHMPEDWDPTTDIEAKVYWAPTDGNAGDVVWDVDYLAVAAEANEVLTAAATALTVTDSTQSLQDELLKTSVMTIVAANLADDDTVSLHLSRDTGDGADTYGASASLVFLELEYTSNRLGEAT